MGSVSEWINLNPLRAKFIWGNVCFLFYINCRHWKVWLTYLWSSDAIWRHSYGPTLVQVMYGNGLLPDGTKPLLGPMLTNHQGFLWHAPKSNFTRTTLGTNVNHNMRLKITLLWLLPHLPGRQGRPRSMMTSSNGNIFRVTGHLCGEFTGPRWIPRTKVSDAQLWCFLWSTPG